MLFEHLLYTSMRSLIYDVEWCLMMFLDKPKHITLYKINIAS